MQIQSIGNNCYRITEDVQWQSGGVWYDNPIDFGEDFTIYYKNNFGTIRCQWSRWDGSCF